MKFVFFGGKESRFAQIVLNGLKESGFEPIAEVRDAKVLIDADYLRSLNADFFLVASFAKILKKEIIEIPPKGTIGVHPSLLPKYRGPSPIQSAILNDEKRTGTTLFLMDEKVDHGSVLSEKRIAISEKDTYSTLEEKLAELSAELIMRTLPKFLSGEILPQPQDELKATYTKKFKTEDAEVNLEKDNLKDVWLKIRALNPEPGAFTMIKLKNGKTLRLKLLDAEYENDEILLTKVQPEGKKPMGYKSFLNGYQKLLK